MKLILKILVFIGTAVVLVPVVAIMLLAVPFVIVIVGSVELYTRLWKKIRQDPKINIEITELRDEDWMDGLSLDDYVQAFERVSSYIAAQTEATATTLRIEGFDGKDDDFDALESGHSIQLSQTLSTKHATVDLEFDLAVFRNSETGANYVTMQDEDAECGNNSPPLDVRVREPKLHIERRFTLDSSYPVWAVISLLRGKVRFTHQLGQLWAEVPEHNIWLVQYKPNGHSYGLRSAFTQGTAREYRRDLKEDLQNL